jgi:hypothetical protein
MCGEMPAVAPKWAGELSAILPALYLPDTGAQAVLMHRSPASVAGYTPAPRFHNQER